MRKAITTEVVRRLPATDVDIADTKFPGLVLRCRRSGTHTYRVRYGRGKWITLGRADVLTPHEARVKARDELVKVDKGHDPRVARQAAKADITLKAFVDAHYEPWARQHQKRGEETVQRLRSVFSDLLEKKLSEITAWMFEQWRTERLTRTGKKPRPETVNSQLTLLKSVLSKAVTWKQLAVHPLIQVKPIKTDKTGRIRYLTGDEEKRLRDALTARDQRRRLRRERANAWRHERGYDEWPDENADHLTPIVLLALNTGLRKGEIFNLHWSDVDLTRAILTVRGEASDTAEGTKTRQTRDVPLNTEAVDILTSWHTAIEDHRGFVFEGREDGERLDDIKTSWLPLIRAAKVNPFTFHDLRHTFASKLVLAGVDLNTVRELLGHTDITMTLRYAHLAPERKAAAVAKLVSSGA